MNPRLLFPFVVAVAWPATAHAEDEEPPLEWNPGNPTTSRLRDEATGRPPHGGRDGVYGRFDGLFDVAVHGGAELGQDGTAGAARLAAHYFSTAGIYAEYADTFGEDSAKSARLLSFGVDLTPMFVPRWSEGLEGSSSYGDLVLDSISLAAGAYFRQPQGESLGDARGLELSLGLGVPLTSSAKGPWLGARGLLRWDDPTEGAFAQNARGAVLLTAGWQWIVGK